MAKQSFLAGTYVVSCVGSDFLSFRTEFDTEYIRLYNIDYTPFPPYFVVSYNAPFDLEYDEGSDFEFLKISDSQGFEFKPLYPAGAELNAVVSRLVNVFDRLGSLDTRLSQIKTNTDRLP